MKKRKFFHYVPKVVEYDIVIDEENLVKAWKKAFNDFYSFFPPETCFDTITDSEENVFLWNILCEAVKDDDYPVFEVEPYESGHVYAYTIVEIVEQFDTDFYNFCWEAVQKIAYDLGLLY